MFYATDRSGLSDPCRKGYCTEKLSRRKYCSFPGVDLDHRFDTFDEGIYGIPNFPKHEPAQKRSENFATSAGNSYPQQYVWKPEYDFEVAPGELFVFFPNYMHETYVPEDSEGKTECIVASTFQYNLPAATVYMRAWLPRLLNSPLGYEEGCHQRFMEHAFLGWFEAFAAASRTEGQETQWTPTLKPETFYQQAADILTSADLNKDMFIDKAELNK